MAKERVRKKRKRQERRAVKKREMMARKRRCDHRCPHGQLLSQWQRLSMNAPSMELSALTQLLLVHRMQRQSALLSSSALHEASTVSWPVLRLC